MTEFAGRLRERVVIEQRMGNRDLLAGATGSYAYAGEAWAALMPLVPADLMQADALSAMPRWQVTMRKREGLDPGTRLTWRRKYLAVRGVMSDPREPAQIVLTCEEVR
ncbi:MAG: head-tail adaptor protein [Sphingorhabdus sp.]